MRRAAEYERLLAHELGRRQGTACRSLRKEGIRARRLLVCRRFDLTGRDALIRIFKDL